MRHRTKRVAKKWIQKTGIAKHKGALHMALGIPIGEKIPVSTLKSASKAPGRTGKEARLALTLRNLHRK